MLQHRKKILLAVLGLLLLGYGGDWLWSVVMEPIQSLRQKQQTLERTSQRRELELAKARKAAKTLADWTTESLPADPQVARSLYQAWLLQLVNRVGLTSPAVDSTQPSAATATSRSRSRSKPAARSNSGRSSCTSSTAPDNCTRSARWPSRRSPRTNSWTSCWPSRRWCCPAPNRTDQLNDGVSDRLAFEHLPGLPADRAAQPVRRRRRRRIRPTRPT